MTAVDVIVAGGGPVGLAAAIEARMAGMSVVLFEPRATPVDKACGEGLMPGALLALARLGVHPRGHPFAGIAYLSPHTQVAHRFRSGPGLGVRRTELHQAMSERAAHLGVEVRPLAMRGVNQDAVGVHVLDGPRGRWLLACDGLHSPVRRALDRAKPRSGRMRSGSPLGLPPRFGLRRHYRVAPWSEFVEVHWTPSAEIYVTPVAVDTVGVAVLGAGGIDYDAILREAPAVDTRVSDAPHASVLRGAGPLWQRSRWRVHGRVLLVGDAAGYVDALTGEGIRIGLAQAQAAVTAIAAGRVDTYEQHWRAITRDYRRLTAALVTAAEQPMLRRRVVPLAARLPKVFGFVVDRLAG